MKISRRDFLKGSAAGALGLAATTLLGPVAASAESAAEEKVNIYKAMTDLWNEHLRGNDESEWLEYIVSILDSYISDSLLSMQPANKKLIPVMKRDQDPECTKVSRSDSACLPKKRRQVFVMSRVEMLSSSEIAERLGISPRTVEKHLELAIRQLNDLNK